MNLRPSAALLLSASIFCGCQPSGERPPASTAGLGLAHRARVVLAPDQVVHGFFEAVRNDDVPGSELCLSEKAREGYARGGFELRGEDIGGFEVLGSSVEGEEASVPVTLRSGEQEHAFTMLLRREGEAWRIRGMSIPLGDSDWVMDFEEEEEADTLTALGEEIAAGLAEGMRDAMEGAMADWENGGSAAEIAVERAHFEALRAVGPEEHDAAWRCSLPGDAPARELLAALVAGTGWALQEGAYADRLGRAVDLELEGLSRIEALERVSSVVGLVPEYPLSYGAFDEESVLAFREGPRETAVAFAGPFLVEVTQVQEEAPHTTGSLTLSLRALGFDPAVLAANRELAEFLRISSVRGPAGEVLVVDEDTRYMGEPTLTGGALQYHLTVELRGLVRGVSHVDLAGEILYRVPARVREVEYEALDVGVRAADDWSVTCTAAGEQSTFELVVPDCAPEALAVHFAPLGADGHPLGILWNSTTGFGGQVRADLQTPERPSGLRLKICEADLRSLPFALRVPLERCGEQPARVEELAFDGPAPVSIAFRRFSEDSGADFRQLVLSIQNAANKDAVEVQAGFEYLDASGAALESFPHTLTGEFTFDGFEPLVPASRTVAHEAPAFFMPEGTHSVRVEVERVEFLDGTVWEQ